MVIPGGQAAMAAKFAKFKSTIDKFKKVKAVVDKVKKVRDTVKKFKNLKQNFVGNLKGKLKGKLKGLAGKWVNKLGGKFGGKFAGKLGNLKNKFNKFKGKFEKIKGKVRNIRDKFNKVRDKFNNIRDKVRGVMGENGGDENNEVGGGEQPQPQEPQLQEPQPQQQGGGDATSGPVVDQAQQAQPEQPQQQTSEQVAEQNAWGGNVGPAAQQQEQQTQQQQQQIQQQPQGGGDVLLSNNNNNNHYNSTVIRCFSSSQFSLRYSFINKEDIQQLLKDKVPDQDFVLIDVRENEEFTSADLPAIHTSAHNIPLNDLGPALLTMDAKQFKYVYGFDKPMVDAHSELATSGYGASRNVSEKPKSVLSGSDSNSALSSKKIIVYCKMGGRAEKAAQLLNDLGFENVFCYKGSASEWWNKK
nr:unnamed protein product [Naegleria fowleri]